MGSLAEMEDGNSTEINSAEEKRGLSPQSLMVNTNTVGFAFLLLSSASSVGTIMHHLYTNSHSLVMHLAVGVCLGTAVLSYTELIRRSGPAVAVAVATLRKVVTVILSYIVFPKHMTSIHLVSAFLLAGGLAVSYDGQRRRK